MFDLSKLGPDARRQLREQGVAIETKAAHQPGRGRYRVSAREDRTVDEITFASKLEAAAYQVLKQFLPRTCFKLQPRYELQAAFTDCTGKKQQAITYVADFLVTLLDGEYVVEIKGFETPEWRLKRKLFLAKYHRPLHTMKTLVQLRDFLRSHGVAVG